MPGEQGGRGYTERGPQGAGAETTQCGKERSITGRVGGACHLASQDGHLVAQGKQFDLIRTLGTHRDDDESEQVPQGQVHEGPQTSPHPVALHPADGSRFSKLQEVPVQHRDPILGQYGRHQVTMSGGSGRWGGARLGSRRRPSERPHGSERRWRRMRRSR